MEEKVFRWISTILMVIIGRDEIVSFIQSFSKGIDEFLSSLPPLALIIIVIILIWLLSKNREE